MIVRRFSAVRSTGPFPAISGVSAAIGIRTRSATRCVRDSGSHCSSVSCHAVHVAARPQGARQIVDSVADPRHDRLRLPQRGRDCGVVPDQQVTHQHVMFRGVEQRPIGGAARNLRQELRRRYPHRPHGQRGEEPVGFLQAHGALRDPPPKHQLQPGQLIAGRCIPGPLAGSADQPISATGSSIATMERSTKRSGSSGCAAASRVCSTQSCRSTSR